MASAESTSPPARGRFADRVVLITGAARGQGRAHALAFAREGARLVICDACRQYRTVPYPLAHPEELATVAREIEALGRPVIAAQVDVTNLPAMEALAERARRELGPIDVVVANAGLYSFALSWQMTEEHWDETVNVDLKGVWITCKVAIPQMLERRQGKIICIGSTASFKGMDHLAHYVAAKHGVIGLVKTLARELAPYNINVNAVCPTSVATSMCLNQALYDLFAGGPGPQATYEHMVSQMNQMNLFSDRNLLPPEDVSAAVLWLASDEARHLTGCALPVDAGYLTR
ncbi:mycofactocin-coupled SDR family oxidoreductase [Thermogemmatispora onikobensis]|uniref:mycofactocin-coupled SDR family oxidoreductase n=1 Tax=Thermogemmatispora onikobensis TaxID=732234 RepID=UPI00085315C3|nr:mycofactocin-coupled SDR family oxidoreductase [Thermogemmatispora onikobensis]